MAVGEKKHGSAMTGPIRSKKRINGVNQYGRTSTVTVAALTTNTAEEYSITDADAEVGDIIIASPTTAPEVGWGIEAAWCATAGTIVVRARNHSGSSLTGGSLILSYAITK